MASFLAFLGRDSGRRAMYLTWSRAGWARVEGVQARYFLPLLPFLIFILPRLGGLFVRLPRVPPGWFCLPAVAMAIVNSYTLPAYIFHLFRMPGP
jgi:hypothetical protein